VPFREKEEGDLRTRGKTVPKITKRLLFFLNDIPFFLSSFLPPSLPPSCLSSYLSFFLFFKKKNPFSLAKD
jgi:hypothetical protein